MFAAALWPDCISTLFQAHAEMFDRILDATVVLLPLAMGVLGTFVGIKLAKNPQDKSHRPWWALIIVLGIVSGAATLWQQGRARKTHSNELTSQNKRVDTLETNINKRFDALEANAKTPEQKKAVTQVKKEFMYDPVFLHRMTNVQIKEAENKLSTEMVDLENQQDKMWEDITTRHIFKARNATNAEQRDKLDQEYMHESTVARNDYDTDFRKNYLNRANAVKEELLFRLRKTPEQAERDAISGLPTMVQMTHSGMSISRALGGSLVGPHPVSDAALYLDGLARQLP